MERIDQRSHDVLPILSNKLSITPYPNIDDVYFRVTHPFHPLCGQEFELVKYHKNWGEDRVFYYDREGHLSSIPACWTSISAPDPFDVISAGRSLFRIADLLELVSLLRGLDDLL